MHNSYCKCLPCRAKLKKNTLYSATNLINVNLSVTVILVPYFTGMDCSHEVVSDRMVYTMKISDMALVKA